MQWSRKIFLSRGGGIPLIPRLVAHQPFYHMRLADELPVEDVGALLSFISLIGGGPITFSIPAGRRRG
jgi:hypothetical protein